MTKTHAFGILLALGCFGFGLSGRVAAQDPAPAKPAAAPKLAAVDVGALFTGYKRKAGFQQRVNERRQAMRKHLERAQAGLRELRKRLETGAKQGEEREALVEQLQIAEFAFQKRRERLNRSLKRSIREGTAKLLSELDRSIERYGQEHGYYMIFKRSRAGSGADLGDEDAQEQIERSRTGDLVFSAKEADITAEVLAYLNSQANLERMEVR